MVIEGIRGAIATDSDGSWLSDITKKWAHSQRRRTSGAEDPISNGKTVVISTTVDLQTIRVKRVFEGRGPGMGREAVRAWPYNDEFRIKYAG
jgi:hypothetical protein